MLQYGVMLNGKLLLMFREEFQTPSSRYNSQISVNNRVSYTNRAIHITTCFCTVHASGTWPLTLRHDDRASVIENGTGITSKVSGQKRERERGKLHIITIYISPNSMKSMAIRSRKIRLARHETLVSTSNPVSAHKIERLKGKGH